MTPAPWAAAASLERLAAVERALPPDLDDALRAAGEAAREYLRRIDEQALLLYAGGNVPRPGQPQYPRLLGQPSMGYPGDKYQPGLEPLDVVEVAVTRAVSEVIGARFADVRPPSATLANLAVYTALARPGDALAVLPEWAGGHLSHHEIGAAGVRGLRVVELPYDARELDVDVDRLPSFLDRERPVLVVVGASLMLRPHRVAAIAERVHDHGACLLYDASHVAGLVAEGRFQAPLAEGADVMTFSTYKSFGRPAGGVIAAHDEALMARCAAAIYPGLTANYDIARLLPLGEAALERNSQPAPTPTAASRTRARWPRRSRPKASPSSAPSTVTRARITSRSTARARRRRDRGATARREQHPALRDRLSRGRRPGSRRGDPDRHAVDHPPGLRRGRHGCGRVGARARPARAERGSSAPRWRRSAVATARSLADWGLVG